MTDSNKTKFYEFSIIRFVAMFSIVFCHIFEFTGFNLGKSNYLGVVGNYLAFGVQIFFFLSGYLYGRRKELFGKESRYAFVKRNFKKILLDYYVYVLAVIVPVYVLYNSNNQSYTGLFVYIFNITLCSGTVGGVHHLWFVPYILFCYLLTPFLFELKEKGRLHNKLFLVTSLAVFSVEIFSYAYKSFFIAAWLNCYILGFFLPDLLDKISTRNKSLIMILGSFLFAFSSYIWAYVRYIVKPLQNTNIGTLVCDSLMNYSRVYVALYIFLLVFFFFENRQIGNGVCRNLLDISDKYSFDIYITHMIYVKGALSLLSVTDNMTANILLVLMATFISALLLNSFCSFLRKKYPV